LTVEESKDILYYNGNGVYSKKEENHQVFADLYGKRLGWW
jgi:hypothetical protein